MAVVFYLILIVIGGCVSPGVSSTQQETQPPSVIIDPITGDAYPTPQLEPTTRERRAVRFAVGDVQLAGELDLPRTDGLAPLAFILHHSGPVGRDAYGYMAELLTGAGFAVFRFDKRGVGASEGIYGCCEARDAVAAYQAAVGEDGIDRERVVIVAQSIGTEHLANNFPDFVRVQRPLGVVLLSSLLDAEQITAMDAPVYIVVSDSETNLHAVCEGAVAAHQRQWSAYGATCYVAEKSEHTLFDIRGGPIDWSDPDWVRRYHRGAMQSMIDWMSVLTTYEKGDRR